MNDSVRKQSKQSLALAIAESFLITWAVMRMTGLGTADFLTAPVFLMALLLTKISQGRIRRFAGNLPLVSAALSGIFTLLTASADYAAILSGLDNGLFRLLILAVTAAGLFFLYYRAMSLFFYYAGDMALCGRLLLRQGENSPEEKIGRGRRAAAFVLRHLPAFVFAGCLVCWLPYFLFEFPGVMTPDSVNQLEQVQGLIPWSNHHPWVHTLLIGLFYRLGGLFTRDVDTALCLYTLAQMSFMAFAASFLISTLRLFRIRDGVLLAAAAFYALVPYNGVFAVTIWKDVPFSGTVLIFTCCLARLLLQRDKRSIPLYVITGILLCLLRSNGWYAFLVSLPFLLFAFRRSLKIMLPLHLGILAAVLLVKGPAMTFFHVTQPDFAESISIPLQQTARVIFDDKPLTAEEWEAIHRVMDTTYLKELYAPGFADNMKELLRAGDLDYLTRHKSEYLKLYLTLGLKYPGEYVKAYIDQTKGYWYPAVVYPVAEADGVIENVTGAVWRPLIKGPAVVKVKEIALKLGGMVPLYGLLWSMGAVFWLFLVCFALSALRGERLKWFVYFPGFSVILTVLIATPVSTEFRYAYSLVYSLPLYLALAAVPSAPCPVSTAGDSAHRRDA